MAQSVLESAKYRVTLEWHYALRYPQRMTASSTPFSVYQLRVVLRGMSPLWCALGVRRPSRSASVPGTATYLSGVYRGKQAALPEDCWGAWAYIGFE